MVNVTTSAQAEAPIEDLLVYTPQRPRFDAMTPVSLVSGLMIIFVAISLTGSLRSFVDTAAILIIVGGSFAIVVTSYGIRDIFMTFSFIFRQSFLHFIPLHQIAMLMMSLADISRRHGVLSLETVINRNTMPPLIYNGLLNLIDGNPQPTIKQLLMNDSENSSARETKIYQVLMRFFEVAPAMGLIGTLIGLVQMVKTLDDPSGIGPAMAVALLTTLYGAIIAHMIFLPLARKQERYIYHMSLLRRIIMTSILSINAQESPRILETKINTLLPQGQSINYYR